MVDDVRGDGLEQPVRTTVMPPATKHDRCQTAIDGRRNRYEVIADIVDHGISAAVTVIAGDDVELMPPARKADRRITNPSLDGAAA
jgi:hypothetical protein